MQFPRVLFVEDNIFVNMDCCEFLRGAGLNVTGVYCAADALALIDKYEALSALVTDIELGPGADGFEIARQARAAYPNLAVIYVSGAARNRHLLEGVERSDFIAKPCHPRQIVAALQRAIPVKEVAHLPPPELSAEFPGCAAA